MKLSRLNMLDKLFEAIDSNVLTDSLKNELEAQFNEAVEIKSTEIATAIIDQKEAELTEALNTKYDAKFEEYKKKIDEQVDSFITATVENLVSESLSYMKQDLDNAKVEALKEAFDALVVTAGTDIAKIHANLKESTKAVDEDLNKKYNALYEKFNALKDENAKIIKLGFLNEMSADLSLVEKEKFNKMAELIPFEKTSAYKNKIELVKTQVKGSKMKEYLSEAEVSADKKSDSSIDYKRFV
nr:MAG TPA: prohead core protein [Caudoviricetes sp.]